MLVSSEMTERESKINLSIEIAFGKYLHLKRKHKVEIYLQQAPT